MDNAPLLRLNHPLHDEARALELTVRTLRRLRGKKNPQDCLFGSPEWFAVTEDFARDIYRALGGDPDDLSTNAPDDTGSLI